MPTAMTGSTAIKTAKCMLQLSLGFDARVRVEFWGTKITSDTGLSAYRVYGDYLSNHERYDEALGDLRTADVYEGRAQ